MMIPFHTLLFCALAVAVQVAVATLPDDSVSIERRYSCQNQAVHIDPLEPLAFAETYCKDRLCVITNSAVLKSVETFKCDVYPNVCSEGQDAPRIGNGPFIQQGKGHCAPVRSAKLTFACPSGDELILTVNDDGTSSYNTGKIVSRSPSAYYNHAWKDNCVNLTTKGNGQYPIDELTIMCYSHSSRICI